MRKVKTSALEAEQIKAPTVAARELFRNEADAPLANATEETDDDEGFLYRYHFTYVGFAI